MELLKLDSPYFHYVPDKDIREDISPAVIIKDNVSYDYVRITLSSKKTYIYDPQHKLNIKKLELFKGGFTFFGGIIDTLILIRTKLKNAHVKHLKILLGVNAERCHIKETLEGEGLCYFRGCILELERTSTLKNGTYFFFDCDIIDNNLSLPCLFHVSRSEVHFYGCRFQTRGVVATLSNASTGAIVDCSGSHPFRDFILEDTSKGSTLGLDIDDECKDLDIHGSYICSNVASAEKAIVTDISNQVVLARGDVNLTDEQVNGYGRRVMIKNIKHKRTVAVRYNNKNIAVLKPQESAWFQYVTVDNIGWVKY
jgi:hypothetical protein